MSLIGNLLVIVASVALFEGAADEVTPALQIVLIVFVVPDLHVVSSSLLPCAYLLPLYSRLPGLDQKPAIAAGSPRPSKT